MSVIHILFRVDDICKKYEKYDLDKRRDPNSQSDEAFARFILKAEAASREKNRAASVSMIAEIRRTKARLKEEFPKLQKLARKKVKELTKEEQETRYDLVLALSDGIDAMPDVTTTAVIATRGWGTSPSNKNIVFDSSDGNFSSDFFKQTKESNQFNQEYEMRKMEQDQCLDIISEAFNIFVRLYRLGIVLPLQLNCIQGVPIGSLLLSLQSPISKAKRSSSRCK